MEKRKDTADDGGIALGNAGITNTAYGEIKFNAERGHGFAAERANHLYDKLTGHDAELVGDDFAKNGADRIVDGVQIQSKYCSSGSKCIAECFNSDGSLRYVNPNGTPMEIEVPSDKYDDAVRAMEERIRRGQVPNVKDPADAKKIVRKGHFTYEQAKNIAKAGTVESLTYDATNGMVVASYTGSITATISLALDIWNGKSLDEAVYDSLACGIRVGGIAFATSILVGQMMKAGAYNLVSGVSGEIVKFMGPKASAMFANSFRNGSNIYGGAAMKNAQRMIGCNIVNNVAVVIVLSSVDFLNLFRGRISTGQFFKNVVNTGASVAGGAAGWEAGAFAGAAIGSFIPGIGNATGAIIGGIIGGIFGGSKAHKVSSAVMDTIIEDDAKEMIAIIEDVFPKVAVDYMLTQKEADETVSYLSSDLSGGKLKDMYASSDRHDFARNLIKSNAEHVIKSRSYVATPSQEEINRNLKQLMEDIAEELYQARLKDMRKFISKMQTAIDDGSKSSSQTDTLLEQSYKLAEETLLQPEKTIEEFELAWNIIRLAGQLNHSESANEFTAIKDIFEKGYLSLSNAEDIFIAALVYHGLLLSNVEPDIDKRDIFLLLAAKMGNKMADKYCKELYGGQNYVNDRILEQVNYWNSNCDDAANCYKLALCYEKGLGGLSVDLERAKELYYASQDEGYPDADQRVQYLGWTRFKTKVKKFLSNLASVIILLAIIGGIGYGLYYGISHIFFSSSKPQTITSQSINEEQSAEEKIKTTVYHKADKEKIDKLISESKMSKLNQMLYTSYVNKNAESSEGKTIDEIISASKDYNFVSPSAQTSKIYVKDSNIALSKYPSTDSSQGDLLNKAQELNVLNFYTKASDKDRLLKKDINVDVDGTTVKLNKDQPVTIIGGSGQETLCQFITDDGKNYKAIFNDADLDTIGEENWYYVDTGTVKGYIAQTNITDKPILNYKLGITSHSDIAVFEAPDQNSKKLASLPKGYIVKVLEISTPYLCQIEYGENQTGYVYYRSSKNRWLHISEAEISDEKELSKNEALLMMATQDYKIIYDKVYIPTKNGQTISADTFKELFSIMGNASAATQGTPVGPIYSYLHGAINDIETYQKYGPTFDNYKKDGLNYIEKAGQKINQLTN